MQDIQQQFDAIQAGLPDLWRRISQSREPRLAVAVPSLSLDLEGLPLPGGLLHFEERLLYLLHLLGQPACQLWFLTSHLISEEEVAYYLHFLRHVPYAHARRRLRLQPMLDRGLKPLTQKLLERPALLERLRNKIRGCPNAYLTVYSSTELEMQLAVSLGLPILGTDPRHMGLASKEQSRQLFESLGLQVPPGRVGLRDLEDLTGAILDLLESGAVGAHCPHIVVKQNQGVSGLGNRRLSLMPFWNLLVADLPREEKQARLAQALRRHWGDAEGKAFWPRFERLGGVVEQHLEGESISVQVHISPLGEVSIVGVLQEMMDEKGRYRGAIFPAPDVLAQPALAQSRKVADELASRGVCGRFEVDFLVQSEQVFALDLNFRKSNSTGSLRTLNLLAGGGYCPDANLYRDAGGQCRAMFTTDWMRLGPHARSPQDIIELATEDGLNYSTATHSGIVFQMLGGASANGRVGVTSVGSNSEEAQALYRQAEQLLGGGGLS